MAFQFTEILILLTAAFLGGALNAVAGGGSFLTLPALIFVGAPATTANATGTVALLPGYFASAWGFRKQLRGASPISLPRLAILSLLGGAVGALLLLVTSDAFFKKLVPWLLLFATAMFAFGPRLLKSGQASSIKIDSTSGPGTSIENTTENIVGQPLYALGILVVSIYGGYFNGGLGIMLLALFAVLGHQDLLAMNALKNLLSAVLTLIAVALYAAGNIVDYTAALIMTPAAIAGGLFGAWLGQRVPAKYIRYTAIVSGLVIAILFFVF